MASDLEKQIAKEAAELANAPKIPIRYFQPGPDKNTRCHFCGQLSDDLKLVEMIGWSRTLSREVLWWLTFR